MRVARDRGRVAEDVVASHDFGHPPARLGDQRSEEHEAAYGRDGGHEWNRYAGHRVPDDDRWLAAEPGECRRDLARVARRVDGDVPDRQVDRRRVAAAPLEDGAQAIPRPAVVPGAVNEDEARHCSGQEIELAGAVGGLHP